MNILTDVLPETVVIDGSEIPINTDFRDSLRIILAFEDPDLTQREKRDILLLNLYGDFPDNVEAAFEQGMWFLDTGKSRGKDESDEVAERLYAFGHDADLIFAAFMQTHHIDLETTDLHWWKFVSLFMAILGTDAPYGNLVGLRKRLKDGTATKEERRAAVEMSDLIDLPEPDTRTPEEIEKEEIFMRAVKGQ